MKANGMRCEGAQVPNDRQMKLVSYALTSVGRIEAHVPIRLQIGATNRSYKSLLITVLRLVAGSKTVVWCLIDYFKENTMKARKARTFIGSTIRYIKSGSRQGWLGTLTKVEGERITIEYDNGVVQDYRVDALTEKTKEERSSSYSFGVTYKYVQI